MGGDPLGRESVPKLGGVLWGDAFISLLGYSFGSTTRVRTGAASLCVSAKRHDLATSTHTFSYLCVPNMETHTRDKPMRARTHTGHTRANSSRQNPHMPHNTPNTPRVFPCMWTRATGKGVVAAYDGIEFLEAILSVLREDTRTPEPQLSDYIERTERELEVYREKAEKRPQLLATAGHPPLPMVAVKIYQVGACVRYIPCVIACIDAFWRDERTERKLEGYREKAEKRAPLRATAGHPPSAYCGGEALPGRCVLAVHDVYFRGCIDACQEGCVCVCLCVFVFLFFFFCGFFVGFFFVVFFVFFGVVFFFFFFGGGGGVNCTKMSVCPARMWTTCGKCAPQFSVLLECVDLIRV